MPKVSPSEGSNDVLRKYIRRSKRLAVSLQDRLFPFHPNELLYVLGLWVLLDAIGYNPLSTATKVLEEVAKIVTSPSLLLHLTCVLTVAVPAILTFVMVVRFSITMMLYYHGWLFESIGKAPSLPTKAFMLVISLLSKRARYFSFQDLMPWMIPPKVDDTIEKYLETVRPLLDDEKYNVMKEQSEEFKSTIASGLQRKLWMKWLISRNYLSDWWKEVVYMRYRNSLINTNVACADIVYRPTTNNQAARAAWVTLNRQQFLMEMFNKNTMKPISLGGIPLCATQYIDYNRTIRLPRETSDVMVRLPDAKHIAIYSKGCWYKINIYNGRRLIKAAELEKSIQAIIDDEPSSQYGEKYLSALTAGPRDLWAKTRANKFTEGVNKESLAMIENALEIVFLDEEERFYDENDLSKYEREYTRSLGGDGYLLWCDKPSVYVISKNGRFTSNAEHSVVDAMIYVHVREYLKYHEAFDKPYGPDGHCIGDIEYVPKAERLIWSIDEETNDAINEAYKVSRGVADDMENAAIVFSEYGKDFMKKAKVSPDAFIQMVLQMAYFKDQQKFELTYEPAVMRLFKDGRTETVRSCSMESCEFVRSMLNEKVKDEERLKLLHKACERHQDYYRNAMAGNGVDRHLFALYVVSKYYQISSPFLDNVFSMNYALSTSQTPQHQTTEYSKALNKEKDLFWPAGAFACPEGSNYGVCYTIGSTGDCLSFHVASWKSLKNTDTARFRTHIVESLREMKSMVENATSSKN
ncbi:unnamed protein product [Auanema sp. JU1783]|nr:unnamed protein product [Auanema sp. JU1783]